MSDVVYSVYDTEGEQIFEGTNDQFTDYYGSVFGVGKDRTIHAYCEIEGWTYNVVPPGEQE